LVIATFALGFRVSVSVAELLAPFESVLPAGAVIVAVLASEVVAVEAIVAVSVNVAVPDTARLTVPLMLPVPDAAGQLEPLVAVHVHVAPVSVPGNVSATVAPVITDGPEFEATIVYVIPWPGTADAAESVFVMDRSPVGVSVSVSVAELFAEFGSVTDAGAATVAVFASVPVAVAAIVPVTVNVAVPPGARVTVALTLPLPDAAGQVDPADAEQVHVTAVMVAGTVSATVAPVAVDGPLLVATIV